MKKENKNDIAGLIYLAENKENHKKYIGATKKSLELRKQDHLQKANKGVGHSFQHAIQTYGADAFSWTSIDTASSNEELARKEKYYIEKHDSFRNGYNSNKGAGFQKPVYQYTSTGELINRFGSLQEACKYLQVDKRCLSKICLSVNHNYNGSQWSYDFQEPFEPKKDLRRKEVIQLNSNNELLATFKSIADASCKTGIYKTSIAKCCRGERRIAGGFIFKNKKETNDKILYTK